MSLDHDTLLQHLRGIQRVVINGCHGGFSLSHAAVIRYYELLGQEIHWFTHNSEGSGHWNYYLDANDPHGSRWWDTSIARDDPYLVQVVEELGSRADGSTAAQLKIIEVPAGVDWVVQEYDGLEWVAEKHRIWR